VTKRAKSSSAKNRRDRSATRPHFNRPESSTYSRWGLSKAPFVWRPAWLLALGVTLGIGLPLLWQLMSSSEPERSLRRQSRVEAAYPTEQQRRRAPAASSRSDRTRSRAAATDRSQRRQQVEARRETAAQPRARQKKQAVNQRWLPKPKPRTVPMPKIKAKSKPKRSSRVAVRPTPPPPPRPKPSASRPSAPSSTQTQPVVRQKRVQGVRLTYVPGLVDRCPDPCILMFRDSQGTLVRSQFPKSRYRDILVRGQGQVLVSGVLTMKNDDPWLAIQAMRTIPQPSQRQVRQPAEPERPASRSKAPVAASEPRRPSAPEAAAEEPKAKSSAERQRARFADRLHRSLPADEAEESEDETAASADSQTEPDSADEEPISRFQQRLRQSLGD
jgi:hypothetical protein